MATEETVVDLYREALGRSPAQAVAGGLKLGTADLDALMEAHIRGPRHPHAATEVGEVWPLISHHTYGNRSLFGSNGRDIKPRAMALLLVHDGLVVADPLHEVRVLWEAGKQDHAIHAIQQTTEELARVEPLLEHGTLRLTPVRPTLRDVHRKAFLEAFGIDPELTVFTNFAEAAVALTDLPKSATKEYVDQASDLFRMFGISLPPERGGVQASLDVRRLAAALIEVSWQFAVASTDAAGDLAMRGPLEHHLAERMIHAGLSGDLSSSRHFSRLDLGGVPNLDTDRLNLADVLAIRSDDSFGDFRSSLRLALDRLDTDQQVGNSEYRARASFEEAMRDAARRLGTSVTKASFRDRVFEQALPAALGVVTAVATAFPIGPVYAGGAGAGVSAATLVWQWLVGRRTPQGRESAIRVLSMLGDSRSDPKTL